ncbi:MAG: hypothetical protein ABI183_19370 [Polyangiaceae bacterium]
MPVEKCECTQCGSTDFTREEKDFLRCRYCHSLFRMQHKEQHAGGAHVVIGKGAHVVFGSHSSVEIRGGLVVEDGAHVSFLGKLEVVERAEPSVVEKAKLVLQERTKT